MAKKLKILVSVNKNSSTLSQFKSLEKFDFDVVITHDLKGALKELVSSHYDVFCVDWLLKKTDVRKTYAVLSQKFKTLCLVFTDSQDPRVTKSLMNGGIRTTIFPPIAVQSLNQRIRSFVKVEEPAGMDSQDLSADVNWKKVGEEGENVWRGEEITNGKKRFHYFKGDKKPEFNKKNKSWNFGSVKLLTTDKETLEAVSENEKKSWAMEDLDQLTAEAPNDSLEQDIVMKSFSETVEKLAQHTKKAVAKAVTPATKGEIKNISVLTKVMVTMCQSEQSQGLLVGANAKDLHDKALMEKVIVDLASHFQNGVPPESIKTEIMELELDPIPFMVWVESMAEFYIFAKHNQEEVAFAYLPFQNLPKITKKDTDHQFIPVKLSHLHPKKKLEFDLHLYMPTNDKYLLYLKKGTVLDISVISKLIKNGLTNLHMPKEQWTAFTQYCAKHKIAEAYDGFAQVKKAA